MICLLTHTTKAPLRFIEGNTGEYGSAPKVTRWGAVARYIHALSRTEIQADARSLLIELAAFLEENGMTGEYAGREEYFLTACLIVLVLSAVVSFRRSRFLSRNFQGRLAAIWPSLCAGICALALIAFDHVQGKKELGPSATTYLIMIIGAFAAGWFAGVFARKVCTDLPSGLRTPR